MRVLVPVVNRINQIRSERGIAPLAKIRVSRKNGQAAFDRLLTGADSAVTTGQL